MTDISEFLPYLHIRLDYTENNLLYPRFRYIRIN